VHRIRVKELLGKTAPFRLPRLQQRRGLQLGTDLAGNPVTVPLERLGLGRADAGGTGSGKTNGTKYHALQAAEHVPGLWLTDIYKSDVRHLRPVFAAKSIDLIVLQPQALKLNVLQADGDPRTHSAMAIDLLQRILDLPARAISILKAILHSLYKKYGNYRGRTDRWPVLHDIYEQVRAISGLNAPAREAILDRLGSLLVALTPGVAAWRYGWQPSDLARHHIVLELRGANEHVKSLHLSHLLFSTLYRRAELGRSNAKLDLVACFEDAQRFFTGSSSTGREILPIEELAGLVRGMGVSLWSSFQSMDGVPRGLLANLSVKFMHRMGTGADYTQLGADLGMTRKQIDWARVNLRPGLCIAQLADGPWRRPFVLKIPHVRIPAAVTDAEIARSTAPLDALPTVPATEYRNWEPNHVITVRDPGEEDDRAPVGSRRRPSTGPHSADERFLRAVIDHPGEPSSAYAKLAGMSTGRALQCRRRLVADGYLREHPVATGRRGRNAIALEPTDLAMRFLRGSSADSEAA
jgi:hypothetical protein